MAVRTTFDPATATKLIKKIPMFKGFNDDELATLLAKTIAFSFAKGETVFLEDDRVPVMYLILKGRVKVAEITPDGQERIMAIRHRGDYFGDMSLLDGKTDFASVTVLDRCTLLLISRNVFDEFFLDNNRALRELVTMLCGRLRDSWKFQKIIGANDAESKIRATLARYGATLGVADSSGVIINTSLSHQSIGDRVLVTRETASRVLSRMREQQEIEIVEGRRIKLLPAFYAKAAQCELYQALNGPHNKH